jgi:hypothetical protein
MSNYPSLLPNLTITWASKLVVPHSFVAIRVSYRTHHIQDDLTLLFDGGPTSAIDVVQVFRDPRDLLWAIFHFESHEPKCYDMIGKRIEVLR